jgi:hypothetical protein
MCVWLLEYFIYPRERIHSNIHSGRWSITEFLVPEYRIQTTVQPLVNQSKNCIQLESSGISLQHRRSGSYRCSFPRGGQAQAAFPRGEVKVYSKPGIECPKPSACRTETDKCISCQIVYVAVAAVTEAVEPVRPGPCRLRERRS